MQRAIQGADGGAGVEDEHPRLLHVHVLVGDGRRIRGELPDDLLEDVLERHQAIDVTVFVDHEAEAPLVTLEIGQLGGQGRALGDEVRLAAARDFDQPVAGEAVAGQFLHDPFHVQHTDEVVEFAFVHRQAGVQRLAQLIEDVLPGGGHVDAGDLLARDHDVVDRDPSQIEDGQQHLPVPRRHQRSGLGHHRAQFIGTQGL